MSAPSPAASSSIRSAIRVVLTWHVGVVEEDVAAGLDEGDRHLHRGIPAIPVDQRKLEVVTRKVGERVGVTSVVTHRHIDTPEVDVRELFLAQVLAHRPEPALVALDRDDGGAPPREPDRGHAGSELEDPPVRLDQPVEMANDAIPEPRQDRAAPRKPDSQRGDRAVREIEKASGVEQVTAAVVKPPTTHVVRRRARRAASVWPSRRLPRSGVASPRTAPRAHRPRVRDAPT